MDKEQQKKLLIELMEEDEKDGLYETNNMERIYSAAIWYKDLPTAKYMPTNIDKGVVVEGHRHADIIRTMVNLLGKRTCQFGEDCAGESEQGFVTNKNRFVDRVEGMRIARAANQVISDTTFPQLYSEDIY